MGWFHPFATQGGTIMGRTNAKVWWVAACAAMACGGEYAQAQPACDTLDYNRDGIVNDFADYAT
jgi:hypothetical protein